MRFFVFVCTFLAHTAFAQFGVDQEAWMGRLNLTGGLPDKLLSSRSVTFYDYSFTDKELYTMQHSFQQTGIDAVAYFELDMLTAGRDITKAFSNYLLEREVANLLFVEKSKDGYKITITLFNGKETVTDQDQTAWTTTNRVLTDLLQALYRASSRLQKMNLLINDAPEQEGKINPIMGKRNEFFALDLKVDPLAVLKTGDEQIDKRLEEIFVNNYPLKFTMAEAGTAERDLRKQGLLYVLCYVHTRGVVAKEVLGFDMSKSESALVSVTYPGDQQELRNIPSNTTIYKFYFKHIDSGNVFFGTKWDADLTWEQALLNQLRGMKAELRLN